MRYLKLSLNERNERGVPVARVIHSFGREEELDREALARLVGSIQRFLGVEETLRASAPEGFRFLGAPEVGGPHVLDALWAELGSGMAISRVAGRGRGRSGVECAVFAMVCQRCLEPASKLEATRWLGRDVVVPGIEQVTDDELYRAMDFLLACGERVQESVFFSVAEPVEPRGRRDLLRHRTSTYFEKAARRGKRRERRERAAAAGALQGSPARPAPGRDRPRRHPGRWIPVRVWVWPGNSNDQTLVEQVKADLAGWLARPRDLRRRLRLLEPGHTSAGYAPAAATTSPGSSSAPGCPRPSRRCRGRAATAPVRDNLRVKEVKVGDGEAAVRYVVCHNPAEADRDRARRQQQLERIETELARLARAAPGPRRPRPNGKSTSAASARSADHPTLSRYLRQTRRGLVLDHARIAAEERLDGNYLLTTSDPTLSAEDVALGYKQLIEAERSFRDLKGSLLLRPVFHRRDDRIRAHVLICFLALVLVRLAETRTGETWRTTRAELGQTRQGHFQSADGEFTQTSELTPRQRTLHAALGVPRTTPPRPHHPHRHAPTGVGTHAQTAQTPANPSTMPGCGPSRHLRRAELGHLEAHSRRKERP